MRLVSILIFLSIIVTECHASLIDHASELPQCGLDCVLPLISQSACKTVLNDTCICTNNDLYNAIEICVSANCNGIDSLAVLRARAAGCDDPVRSNTSGITAMLVLDAIAIMCVCLRVYSRWKITVWLFDDYIMLVVLVALIPFIVISAYDRITAFGVDVWTLTPEVLTVALKLFYVDEALYIVVLSVTKIMVLCFYYRMFPPRPFRLCCIATMVFIGLSGFSCLMAQLLQCLPVRYNWDGWKKDGSFGTVTCLDINALITACAILAIVQDIIVLALPIPIILKLNASWRKRAGIIIMFSFGIVVTITSCLRLQFIVQFWYTTNPTWDNANTLTWTTFEVNLSVICACLPALRAYFGTIFPKIFGTTHARRSTGPEAPARLENERSPPNGRAKKPFEKLDTAVTLTECPSTTRKVSSDTESQRGIDVHSGEYHRV